VTALICSLVQPVLASRVAAALRKPCAEHCGSAASSQRSRNQLPKPAATAATALQQWWIASLTSKKVTLSEPEVASLKLGYLFSCCVAIWLLFQIASFALFQTINFALRHSPVGDVLANILLIAPFLLGLLFIGFVSYKGRRLAPREIQSSIAVLLPLTLILTQWISYIFPSAFELAKGPPLQITALSCKPSDASYLDVDAVVANLTDTTLILQKSHMTIRGNPRDRDGKLYNQTGINVDDYRYLKLRVDDSFSEYTILEPQKTIALRLKSRTWLGPSSDWGNRVVVYPFQPRKEGACLARTMREGRIMKPGRLNRS
jgi:hypothetical protein